MNYYYMKKITLAILTLTLISCVTQPQRVLTPPQGANVGHDNIQCQSLAMQEITMQGLNHAILGDWHLEQAKQRCLQTLGYK